MTVGGRLFQAMVPAAEKDRSPSVDLRVAGTTNADELEDLRRCRDSNCATCCNCSERYAGARLCLHLNTVSETSNIIVKLGLHPVNVLQLNLASFAQIRQGKTIPSLFHM